MSLDLDLDETQSAVADTVSQFCREQSSSASTPHGGIEFSAEVWRSLAQLGVLAAGSEAEEGSAGAVCASMEALGHAVFPGPLVGSYLAQRVLPADWSHRIATGESIVSVGTPPLLSWGGVADIFLEVDGENVFQIEPDGDLEVVSSIAGDPWSRGRFTRSESLGEGAMAVTMAGIAKSAYLAAAGMRMVGDAAEYARTRRQFGRPIGEFQAVSHPLSNCQIRLEAAKGMARAAASLFDLEDLARARSLAVRARISASAAALMALEVGHQVFGAIGITLEGPAFHISRRIRSLISEAPGPAAARACILGEMDLAP